jgi:hypothetical protein
VLVANKQLLQPTALWSAQGRMHPFELPQMDSCLGSIEKASEMAIEGTMSSAQLAAGNIL